MATVFFFLERFIVCLAGLKETLVLGGFSGSEEYFLCFKMSQVYFMCCSVFPGLVGQEFIFPACH